MAHSSSGATHKGDDGSARKEHGDKLVARNSSRLGNSAVEGAAVVALAVAGGPRWLALIQTKSGSTFSQY